ncbi:AAA family ATPase [Vibrio rotiferianus]|uniref:FimV/HubP family polar landmark protein n=1 Tax=Vibrio rotiferianus TaxID=190895 RepID=UPI00111084C8|nr:FimV/HubP family polar landmark protein [Vibrio rotiferianus]TMX32719.1 AAA family ATPase [Vibrio rotiferianus]TMX52743.1 AAA family ATPase [Vibrio rotiferianus]TMX58761.1 AAA family ATPase [Vibrio rotiferianus]
MHQNYKRLLAALMLMGATQTSSVVQAEAIRLVGPSGEVQAAPSYAEQIERALPATPENLQPSRFYGPTGQNETLWSIATKLRPSNSVSVQQTLLAIYRINPQAFENQNIHLLEPGSRLRVPSLEQTRIATTAQAAAVMKAHQAKLNQATQPKPVEPKPEPVRPVQAKPEPQTTTPKINVVQPEEVQITEKPLPKVETSPQGEQQVSALKEKLQVSQGELESLEEKNHHLRLMLSEVQTEVDSLKTELNDEERIRSEVEKLLAEERQRVAEQQRMQPSTLDKILSNGWLVGLAALIPGVLIALLIVMLLGRRSAAKEEAAETETPTPEMAAAPLAIGDSIDELDEELSLDDDLFGDDSDHDELFSDDSGQEDDDVFASLDDDDLDFNLEGEDGEDPFAGIGDDGDLDVGLDDFDSSANGISVNGEEKALGLEEMERALDEVSPELDLDDTASGDDSAFDLSDEPADTGLSMSEDEFSELLSADEPTEELESGALDQSMLDDLFSGLAEEDDAPIEDSSPSEVNENAFGAGMASDDDIDQLLAQYEQPAEEVEEAKSTANDEFDLSEDSDASALLDELLGEDDGGSLSELDPLEELEELAGYDEEHIDESSTDLLDELIDLDEDDSEDFDPLNELEQLSGFDNDSEALELDENSTELLDELLDSDADEFLEEDSESDKDAFDELIGQDDTESDEDELLSSLGFEELLAEQSPAVEESSSSLDTDFDIDALVAEQQVEGSQAEDEQSVQAEEERSFDRNQFVGDLEEISPKGDALLNELSEAEAQDEPLEDAEVAFEAESALESEPSDLPEPVVEEVIEPEFEEPKVTPTPNTSPNEFGVPQEEDWLLDEESSQPEQPVAEAEEFNFDELELPEFGEEDAMAEEPAEPEVAAQPEQPVAEAEEFDFDELGLPEFGEEDAMASMAEEPAEPEVAAQPEQPVAEAEEFNFDELELPEFGEDDAMASMAEELAEPEVAAQPEQSVVEDEEFNFDELELPEFGEEDAMASMAEEPAEPEIVAQPEQPVAEDEEFNFDELELPEFGEEDAMASMAEEPAEPEVVAQPEQPVAESEEFNFDELELPEFGEEDAMASMAEELAEPEVAAQPEQPVAEAEEFDFDELELPEFGEEDAMASVAEEPAEPEVAAQPEQPVAEAEEFDFDELELPEFGEEDAMASMAEELAKPEVAAQPEQPVVEDEEFNFDELELPEFGEEDAMASLAEEPAEPEAASQPEQPVVEDEEFNFDELELPEFGEEDAMASVAEEPAEPKVAAQPEQPVVEDEEFNFDELELPEFGEEDAMASMAEEPAEQEVEEQSEQDALFDMFAQPSETVAPEFSAPSEPEVSDFDEAAMANLLSEDSMDSETFDTDLDSDTIASAGMDIEAMLDVGDDWDGFKLSPETEYPSRGEEVPEDEREVWSSSEALEQPRITEENWGEQEDLTDFDPKKNQFMTIDELMAQVDKDGGEFEEQDLKLDVGLNEFPDVIGDNGDVDVDSNAEAAGKLDLAKIYLEMNDPQGAVKLLEEAIVYGEDDIRREAKGLIDAINGR